MIKILGGTLAVTGLLAGGMAAGHAAERHRSADSTVLALAEEVKTLSSQRSVAPADLSTKKEELAREVETSYSALSSSALVKVKLYLPRCAKTIGQRDRGGNGIDVPASRGGSTSCIIKVGDRGEAALSLKISLDACHQRRPVGNIRDKFQYKDRNALKAVQREARISADGVFGPQTSRTILYYHAFAEGWGSSNGNCGQRR